MDEAARLGIDTHRFEPGEDPVELCKAAVDQGASALGAAGGDGTLGAVAGVAIEAGVPFVSVPFGTRNHFARDVGFDLDDPLAALAAFRDGRELKVDAARVDGRVFLNNVSLGVYAQLVHDPAHQTKNRLVALGRLFTAAFGRTRRRLDVVFDAGGTQERHNVVVMLVSNNAYVLEPGEGLGSRERLDEGLLYAYVVEAETRWALVKLLFRAVLGRVERGAGWTEYSAPSFRVSSRRRRLHAAVDGEAVVLDQELDFEILPCALRVLIPTGSRDQVDGAARRP